MPQRAMSGDALCVGAGPKPAPLPRLACPPIGPDDLVGPLCAVDTGAIRAAGARCRTPADAFGLELRIA
jgi:hypothetical protein